MALRAIGVLILDIQHPGSPTHCAGDLEHVIPLPVKQPSNSVFPEERAELTH